MLVNAPQGIASFKPPRRALTGPGPATRCRRIGLMGASSTPQNVTLCLDAPGTLLAEASSR